LALLLDVWKMFLRQGVDLLNILLPELCASSVVLVFPRVSMLAICSSFPHFLTNVRENQKPVRHFLIGRDVVFLPDLPIPILLIRAILHVDLPFVLELGEIGFPLFDLVQHCCPGHLPGADDLFDNEIFVDVLGVVVFGVRRRD
jgi:hypothetical protein